LRPLRTITSATLALVLAALLGTFYYAESFAPPVADESEAPSGVVMPFHALERLENAPTEGTTSNCSQCHSSAPHVKDKRIRAFLNLHLRVLDCSICHLGGGNVEYVDLVKPNSQDPEDKLVTAVLKGSGVPSEVRVDETSNAHSLQPPRLFKAKGVSCKSCHRRGSTTLRALGRYDGYRRRILEDIEILSLLERNR
jgi:hypothetical protein